MSELAVTEAELHALVDGLLPEARRVEVEAYLAAHAEDAQRMRAWRAQNQALRELFDPVLAEALPARPRQPWMASSRRPLRLNVCSACRPCWPRNQPASTPAASARSSPCFLKSPAAAPAN